MTVDTINPAAESFTAHVAAEVNQAKKLTYIALAFAIAGLAFCWYPILGAAHAIAGTILGVMAYKRNRKRVALSAIIIGAIAIIASAILTIAQLNSIEVVNTYSAAPWI